LKSTAWLAVDFEVAQVTCGFLELVLILDADDSGVERTDEVSPDLGLTLKLDFGLRFDDFTELGLGHASGEVVKV